QGRPGGPLEYRYRCGGEGGEGPDLRKGEKRGPGARAILAGREGSEGGGALAPGKKGGGWLKARLPNADGRSLGGLHFARAQGGPFGAEDEAIAVQLAHLSVLAVENILYSEAQEANRLQEEFLATLSHELRTPLQAVLSWSRILRMDRIDRALITRG